MDDKPTQPNQFSLPGSIDEVLHRTIDDIVGYKPHIDSFNLSNTFSHIYRLLMPKLMNNQMTLGIRTDPAIKNEIRGCQYGFAQTAVVLFNHLIEQLQSGKITVKITQEKPYINVHISCSSTTSFSSELLQQQALVAWSKKLGYQFSTQSDEDGHEQLLWQFEVFSNELDEYQEPYILVCEDNDVNAMVLQNFLTCYSNKIHRTRNGKQGLVFVEQNTVDIIMMDINMPVMDGIEACKRIRNHKNLDKQPVIIAVTADSTEAQKAACKNAGMDDFIAKPYTADQLKVVLSKYLKL